jgi:serine phosphatase RsbU (regulator of sigma subunit)/CHASE3 domain sensor protein
MSLRSRLLLLLVGLVVVVVIGGSVGLTVIAARDRQNTALQDLTIARRRVEQLSTTYAEQQNNFVAFLFSNGQEYVLNPYNDRISASRRLVRAIRSDLRPAPRLRQRLDRVDRLAGALLQRGFDPAISLVRARRQTDAVLLLVSPPITALANDVRSTLNGLGSDIDAAIRQRSEDRDSLNTMLLADLVATLAGLGVCMVVAAILIERWTKRPIDTIAAAVREVRAGELATAVPAVGPPELAALGRDVDEMRARIIRELGENVRAREALEQNATVVLALRRLLEPQHTGVPVGWDVASALRPAEGIVAGDSYDVALLPDGNLAVVVIDIAGHGAVSAVASLRCQELLGVALADGRKPGDALSWLLEQIRDPGIELFFSAFVATVDPATGRCCYANAGHPAALLATDTGVVNLGPTGPIVGPIAALWDSEEIAIRPGDALAIYTDGLTDPRNVDDHHSPLRQPTELLVESPRPDADEVVRRSLDALEVAAIGRLRDDVTLLVVCRAAGTNDG